MPAVLVKSIIPNTPSLPPLLVKHAKKHLDIIAARMQRDYEKTTKSWTRKPTFTKTTTITGAFMRVTVGTDNEIYGYVDKGTRKHPITPKPTNRRGLLFFKPGYRAKTTPRIISSSSGGSFGKVVAAKKVMHPGTVSRKFTVTIQEKWRPIFNRRMQGVMRDIARDYERLSKTVIR